jgi:hypothetical protein
MAKVPQVEPEKHDELQTTGDHRDAEPRRPNENK